MLGDSLARLTKNLEMDSRKKGSSQSGPPAPSGWCGSCCWETGCLLPVCDGVGGSVGNTPA